jgi:transposase
MSLKLSKFEQQVNALLLENKLTSSISSTLDRPSRSITNAISRIKKKNSSIIPTTKPKLGRPTKITKNTKRAINRDLTRSPKKTNKRILEENSLDLSIRSLQRLLREEGYSITTAKKKSTLDAPKAKNRLVYAKQTLKNIKNINFKKVIFSDESAIQRGHGARTEYCRKRQNKRTGREQVSTTNRSKFKNNPKRLKYSLENLVFFYNFRIFLASVLTKL